MIKCAYCYSEIEPDSIYCDQCSQPILLCETCGQPGRGEWCEEDGGKLVPNTGQENEPVPPAVNQIPALKLIDEERGLSITIDLTIDGGAFGTRVGTYLPKTDRYAVISGSHLVFSFDGVDWLCKDPRSTNRTRYSTKKMTKEDWAQIAIMEFNTDVKLADNSYLWIGSVVFKVACQTNHTSNNSTQRVS